MDVLRKFKASAFAVMIVYFIVGLIMLLNPSFIGDAVNYVIGILIVIYGIVYYVSLYQKKEAGYNKFDMLAGVLCISFGAFLIIYKDILVSLIPFCIGIVLLMDSVGGIIKSFKLKNMNLSRWWIVLIFNLIFLGFSIFIIANAKNITELFIRIIGGFLICDALLDFLLTLRINHVVKSEVRDIQVIEKNN